MTCIALILLLFPINLFDGEIVYRSGISTIVEPRPLSLHFIAGIEGNATIPDDVVDYYLTTKGYILAFLFIFGLPAIIAYRVFLGKRKDV